MTDPTLRVWKMFDRLPPLMPADASALGTMPTDAFRYCEAMRTASGFGWYVFPPRDLTFTLSEDVVYMLCEGDWVLLKSDRLDDDFQTQWAERAPADLHEHLPAFVRALPLRGVVQIFTGYFVETAPEWSISVRSPVNVPRRPWRNFEGIIETDEFSPCPLFTNIEILETSREIYLPVDYPLAQIQPIPRAAYTSAQDKIEQHETTQDIASSFPWARFADTVHVEGSYDPAQKARYAVSRRKRSR